MTFVVIWCYINKLNKGKKKKVQNGWEKKKNGTDGMERRGMTKREKRENGVKKEMNEGSVDGITNFPY